MEELEAVKLSILSVPYLCARRYTVLTFTDQPRKKDASRKRPRPSSDDGEDDGEEDAEEDVVDLTENVSVTQQSSQQSSQQKAPRTPRKKRNATPPHDFSPINRPPRLSSATLPSRKVTTASKKPKKEKTPAPAQKKGKTGKVQSDATLRSLEQLRQQGLINEDSLAKQIRRTLSLPHHPLALG